MVFRSTCFCLGHTELNILAKLYHFEYLYLTPSHQRSPARLVPAPNHPLLPLNKSPMAQSQNFLLFKIPRNVSRPYRLWSLEIWILANSIIYNTLKMVLILSFFVISVICLLFLGLGLSMFLFISSMWKVDLKTQLRWH